MKRFIGTFVFMLSVLLGIATSSFAQQKQAPPPDIFYKMDQEKMMQERIAPFPPMPPQGDFVFFASEMGFSGKLVKGAPYSAEAVTESIQTLSDGNRIINKSTASLYRDSEGRTRREQALKAIGPFASSGEPSQSIYISDPVADVSYVLDPRTQTARKMPPMRFKFEVKVPPPGEEKTGELFVEAPDRVEVEAGVSRKTTEDNLFFKRQAAGVRFETGWRNYVGRNESLGKQNIGGVEAEGTRSTVTIPAGEIGNERPIEIVSERWFAPELQIVVMTRHNDPRFGETTYRLTNIDRSEPARALFEVPAGYTFKEGMLTPAPDLLPGAISGGMLNGKAISLPPPTYPPIAKQARASGTVTVQVTIDEDGNVISAKAVSGHPLLQAAAVTAARQAKFSPTKLEGQPVKVQGVLTYNFAPE